MSHTEENAKSVYDVPLEGDIVSDRDSPVADELGREMLVANARWFCRLRWVVIASFLGFGVLGNVPFFRDWVGLAPPRLWPFLAAGALILENLLFLHDLVHCSAGPPALCWIERNLWGQILIDLTVLTVAVHCIGTGVPWLPFVYLFHIILACIFFPGSASLMVTLCAVFLYAGLRLVEISGFLTSQSIFAEASRPVVSDSGVVFLDLGGTVVVWFVAWGLVSHLGHMVRVRDRQLAATNTQLRRSQQERTEHMLRTTHELKSPFSAISANAQLLLKGYCGELTPRTRDVVQKIALRCERLAHEIQEMLQLANLNSSGQAPPSQGRLALDDELRKSVSRFDSIVREKGLHLTVQDEPVQVCGAADHLQMLLQNLLSNAMAYSREGGRVQVRCYRAENGEVLLEVADEGIGIAAEKLPLIFDAHYRTDEAARVNPHSSGLGLAILKQTARHLHARVRVTSVLEKGTTFQVCFPPFEAADADIAPLVATPQKRSKGLWRTS